MESRNRRWTRSDRKRLKMEMLWILAAVLLTIASEASHWYRHFGEKDLHHLGQSIAHATLTTRDTPRA